MSRIGTSDLDVFPLALGGNVFGWTADKATSFAVLDAFVAGGGNFIDSADSYSVWIPGHVGGESETIIGEWMQARGNREQIVIATKVGQLPLVTGTSRASVRQAVEDSLRRLQVETIDLYYAHIDDQATPLEETAEIFGEIVKEGKVRHVAASNFTPERLQAALDAQKRLGVATYVALQPHYNLMERAGFETGLRDVVAANGLSTVPYFGLAKGFLTGKYRAGGPEIASPRAGGASQYLGERGSRVLAALDEIAGSGCKRSSETDDGRNRPVESRVHVAGDRRYDCGGRRHSFMDGCGKVQAYLPAVESLLESLPTSPEEADRMENKPGSNGVLTLGTGIALGAGLGLIVALITDLTIPLGIVVGAAAGLLAMLFVSRRP